MERKTNTARPDNAYIVPISRPPTYRRLHSRGIRASLSVDLRNRVPHLRGNASLRQRRQLASRRFYKSPGRPRLGCIPPDSLQKRVSGLSDRACEGCCSLAELCDRAAAAGMPGAICRSDDRSCPPPIGRALGVPRQVRLEAVPAGRSSVPGRGQLVFLAHPQASACRTHVACDEGVEFGGGHARILPVRRRDVTAQNLTSGAKQHLRCSFDTYSDLI